MHAFSSDALVKKNMLKFWKQGRGNKSTIIKPGCNFQGHWLHKFFRADGVNVRYQKKKEHETGKCAVLITGKHRSLIADLGAVNIILLKF